MEEIKLLILDDDNEVIKDFTRSIELFNENNQKYKVLGYNHETMDLSIIKNKINPEIHGVIIDMKWGKENDYGVNIIEIAKNKLVPFVIYSGNDFDLGTQNDLMKFISKTTEMNAVIEHFVNLYNTNMFEVFGENGLLMKEIKEIFWNHAAFHISEWKDFPQFNKSSRLMRYIVSRMYNKLMITEDGKNSDSIYSSEYYINPPSRDIIHSGLVVKEISTNKKFVVMNAACDMERGLPDKIILCENNNTLRNKFVDGLKKASNSDGRSKLKNKFKSIIKNSNSQYQYLPPYKSIIQEMFLDFQMISSVDKKCAVDNEKYEKLYTINPIVFKDIQYRFSHYYARQGQPELDENEIDELIKLEL